MKREKCLLSLLLALALLLGCGAPAAWAEVGAGMIPFGEMPYVRPDLDALQQNVDALGRAVE